MSNPLVLQVIGVLLVLFFIFLLVMCWKTWRITHILFTFFVFASAVVFLIFASMVLKTQNAWRTEYNKLAAQLEQAEAENALLQDGDLLQVNATEASLRSLQADLDDEMVDRGRVWRGCSMQGTAGPNQIRILTVPANLPQGATPQPNGLRPGDILYIFTEEISPEGWRLPDAYLGEYEVKQATDTEAVVSETLPLAPEQAQKIRQGGPTWTLYEIMPRDDHFAFAEWDETEKRMVGMSIEELKKYFPEEKIKAAYNWTPEEFNAFLEKYRRFNSDATDDDPPEDTWMMVKFLTSHSIQVDSDTEQSLLDGQNQYFDSSGRATESRLQRGDDDGTVQFEVDDTAVFDRDTADTLIADGVCEKVKLVYRRSLDDFENFFRASRYRHLELDESIQRVKEHTAELVTLKTKADQQIAYRSDEKVKLEKDLAGFQKELADVTQQAQALEQAWIAKRKALSEMFQENYLRAAQLTQIQAQLAAEINRRVRQETASNAP
jgi:hypothetical protein